MTVIVVLTLAGVVAAFAHDALPSTTQPLGWTYDYSCCSAFDCRSVGTAAVAETSEGYVVKLTGEKIPYGDKRIKRSKDEYFHQCTIGGDPKATHSICLYVPDRGL
ncbi:MAG: hypothetical protein E5V63_04205 [Mesorhizobium sp.]|nr:MAG: hypothetical protein E5V63_04205 [Mesorhizobium sp.]